jgi:hypothetical protein
VERLGYESTQSPVPSAGGPVEIVVRAAPLPLPGFRVEVERDVCSAPEEAVARSLWEAAVRLHAAGLDTLGIATYTEEWTDTMSTDGSRSGGAARSSPGQRASAPLLRVSWSRRVERQGYGFPVRRSDRQRSYDSWSYPPLEADFASHFVGESFGSLHEFHLDMADAEGWVLRFCGTEQDRPFLLGALELGPDTLIRRAEWQFFTPEPDEGAGGWARFDPTAQGGGASALLPRESLIWRTLPGGSVVRRAQSYLGWITTPGDSVPFLPARVEAAEAGGGG